MLGCRELSYALWYNKTENMQVLHSDKNIIFAQHIFQSNLQLADICLMHYSFHRVGGIFGVAVTLTGISLHSCQK